jgi:uncharacterized membrane protein YdcZ (DUF606 family)
MNGALKDPMRTALAASTFSSFSGAVYLACLSFLKCKKRGNTSQAAFAATEENILRRYATTVNGVQEEGEDVEGKPAPIKGSSDDKVKWWMYIAGGMCVYVRVYS